MHITHIDFGRLEGMSQYFTQNRSGDGGLYTGLPPTDAQFTAEEIEFQDRVARGLDELSEDDRVVLDLQGIWAVPCGIIDLALDLPAEEDARTRVVAARKALFDIVHDSDSPTG